MYELICKLPTNCFVQLAYGLSCLLTVLIVRLETGALARAISGGVAWPRRLALPAQKVAESLHPSPPPCKQYLIIYFLSRNAAIGTHAKHTQRRRGSRAFLSAPARDARLPPSTPLSPPTARSCLTGLLCVCVRASLSVFVRGGGDADETLTGESKEKAHSLLKTLSPVRGTLMVGM